MAGVFEKGYLDSGSSSDDPKEFDRIREWMDRPDWGSVEAGSEADRDTQICIALLSKKQPQLTSDFVTEGSDDSQEASVSPLDSEHQKPKESANPLGSKPRFANPELLGVGSFGIVFSVRDERLGMDVAIKMLRPSKSHSKELRSRFIDEAQLTASLSHPNIVRFYETGHIEGLPYISYDRFDVGTLADQILTAGQKSESKKLSARQSAWVVSRIADAVHFAHSKAILHRDLKPSNVLLKACDLDRSEQLGFEPMLTDFGLAKRLNSSGRGNNQTLDGHVLGTVRYMSPEQAKGAVSEIATTSEVFSIGAILYQLLVGRVPFDDPFDLRVRTMICDQDPIRPRLLDRSISPDLEAITLKCLAKKPSDRYQSAHELQVELERFLKGEPVLAKKSTFVRRWVYACRRNPISTSVFVLAVIVNCFALLGLTVSLMNERAAKKREREALLAFDAVFTEFADDIFAGKRIKDEIMLELSQSMLGVLESYIRKNPNDEILLHRISVLKHYQSMAIQRFGTPEQYVTTRLEVLDILSQLCEQHPENEKYQYQKFFAKLLIGNQLAARPDLQPNKSGMSGIALLKGALRDIELLAIKYPDKIEYQDALAATKISVSYRLKDLEPLDYRKRLIREAVTISKGLMRAYPDRPLLAKHAIDGYVKLAQLELSESQKKTALEFINKAEELRAAAWGAIKDEIWVLEETQQVGIVRAQVLKTNEMFPEAIRAYNDLDRVAEQLRMESPNQMGRILPQIYNCQKHRDLLIDLGDLSAAEAVEKNMIRIVSESLPNQALTESLQVEDVWTRLPESVQEILKKQ